MPVRLSRLVTTMPLRIFRLGARTSPVTAEIWVGRLIPLESTVLALAMLVSGRRSAIAAPVTVTV